MAEATKDLMQKLVKEALPYVEQEACIGKEGHAVRRETSEYTRWIYRTPVSPEKISVFGLHTAIHDSGSHNAVDFCVPKGTDVRAPADGTIVEIVENSKHEGETADFQQKSNGILIKTPWDEFVWLGCCSSPGLKPGEQVVAGGIIGKSGDTGHVPMEVLKFIGNASSKKSVQNYAAKRISFCWEIPFDVYIESMRR